jgi:divalent metal cation (Fe/Co/Zn/Cd) transporter
MHRKRQSSSELNDIPVLTDAVDEDDDIPLLTDIDSDPVLEESSAGEIVIDEQQDAPAASPLIDPGLRDQLVHELASRIEERLRAALPQIINSTVKDFLAEQEMMANN